MQANRFRVAAFVLVLFPALASAAPRAWVSATFGVDTGICTRPVPCRTFTYAISQVDAGGEVNVLDSGGYGAMMITKAVTINVASGVTAGIVASVAHAIKINASTIDKIVLRGLTISATGDYFGINAMSFGALYVENCTLNWTPTTEYLGFPTGISVASSAGAKVFIVDTIVRNFPAPGIKVTGAVDATIERTRSVGNGEGVLAEEDSRTTIRESVLSGNSTGIGVSNGTPGSTTTVTAANNAIANNTGNGVGVSASGGGTSQIALTGNTIAGNSLTGVVMSNSSGTTDVTLSGNTVHDNGVGVQFFGSGGTQIARTRNDNTFLHNTGGDVTGGSLITLLPK